jgi:hypothetical protein
VAPFLVDTYQPDGRIDHFVINLVRQDRFSTFRFSAVSPHMYWCRRKSRRSVGSCTHGSLCPLVGAGRKGEPPSCSSMELTNSCSMLDFFHISFERVDKVISLHSTDCYAGDAFDCTISNKPDPPRMSPQASSLVEASRSISLEPAGRNVIHTPRLPDGSDTFKGRLQGDQLARAFLEIIGVCVSRERNLLTP